MFGIFTRHSSLVIRLSLFHVKPSDPYSLKIIIFYFKLKIYKNTLSKLTLL